MLLLVKSGIQLDAIYNLPLDVFRLYVAAEERLEARNRVIYITDTSAAVASLFSSDSKVKEYVTGLENQYLGETNGRR